MDGHTSLMVHACAVACSQMASHMYFISQKTTPPCPAGSRAWRLSFRSAVCGLSETRMFLPSAQVFAAPLAARTAIAGGFSFHSPISCLKSPSFKSWSSLVATCATFTPNTTVNSISSSSIGVLQSFVFGWQGVWQQLRRWRGRSSNPWMMSPSLIFSGESSDS